MSVLLEELLACPDHGGPLRRDGDSLFCAQGESFPIAGGIPVLLPRSLEPTQPEIAHRSMAGVAPTTAFTGLHPHVLRDVAATGGRLYAGVTLTRYPIPAIRLPAADGARLLDIGCNWGRWAIAAAQRGYRVIGIDPNLEALQAAQHVAAELGVEAEFVAGDARMLPFADRSFDVCYSYSVLQHFAQEDVLRTLAGVRRVLRPGGYSMIQMANALGTIGTLTQARRGFRPAREFEVRYWTPRELRTAFDQYVGPSTLSADTFIGLGAQPADADMLPFLRGAFVRASDLLRRLTDVLPPLRNFADSLYVRSALRTHGG